MRRYEHTPPAASSDRGDSPRAYTTVGAGGGTSGSEASPDAPEGILSSSASHHTSTATTTTRAIYPTASGRSIHSHTTASTPMTARTKTR